MNASQFESNLNSLKYYWHDYIVFLVMIIISVVIGLYHGLIEKKVKSVTNYLLGTGNMSVLPVAVSIVASLVSGLAVMVIPGEIYRFGAKFWLSTITILLSTTLTVFVYLPVLHTIKILSLYEYLEKRFDVRVRVTASTFGVFVLVIISSFMVYMPSLALAAGSGLSVDIIAPIVSTICVFYTTMGGIKTVVWTDVLQGVVLFGTMIVIVVAGSMSVGGFNRVWELSSQSGRLDIFDFDINPTKRETIWTFTVGYTWHYISVTILNPPSFQRYLLLPTLEKCFWTAVFVAIGTICATTLTTLMGLVLYAKYYDCDPIASHKIDRIDQLVSYFIIDLSKHIPGINGVFIGGVFAAGLSTQSSIINAGGLVLFEDFFRKIYKKPISEEKAYTILKTFVFTLGMIATVLTIFLSRLQTVWPYMVSVVSAGNGPISGIVTAGILVPKTNSIGALSGMFAGFVSVLIVMIPAKYYQLQGLISFEAKPISIDGCFLNSTLYVNNTQHEHFENVPSIFKISFYYYGFIGFFVSIVVATLISYWTKNNKLLDEMLIHPGCRRFIEKPECSYKMVNVADDK